MSVRRDVETVGTLCGADMESRSAALAIKQEVADGVFDVLLYGAFQSPCAILGIITEDDDGNAASFPQEKCPSRRTSRSQSSTAQKKIPLSQILSSLNLADYIPHYRKYLEQLYGCPVESMTNEQYQEQVEILRECKGSPLAMRGLIKTLNPYRKPQPIRQ